MIDIILPLHNPDNNVYKAIDSIIDQTYNEWSLYIVDDASNPSPLDNIKKKYSDYLHKISFSRFNQNKRAASCRNYAISTGTGKYITFIDQDDIWVKDKLEKQIAYFEKNNIDAVHGNVKFIDLNGDIILNNLWEKENQTRNSIDWVNISKVALLNKIYFRPNIRLISSMVSREVFETIGGFKEHYFGGEDEIFWLEVIKAGTVHHIEHTLFFRREHENNTVNVHKSKRLIGYYKALKYIRSHIEKLDKKLIKQKKAEIAYLIITNIIKSKNFQFSPQLIINSPSILYYSFYFFLNKKRLPRLNE